jgi:hypothetical protein
MLGTGYILAGGCSGGQLEGVGRIGGLQHRRKLEPSYSADGDGFLPFLQRQ